MEPRRALIVAIVAAAAAVGIVAADTVYGIQMRLETLKDGEWQLVGDTNERYVMEYSRPMMHGVGCASQTLRVTVDNHKPFAETVTVESRWHDYTQAQRDGRIFRETWELGAFEARTREFTVPAEAEPRGAPPDVGKQPGNLDVFLDDVTQGYLSACVVFNGTEASS